MTKSDDAVEAVLDSFNGAERIGAGREYLVGQFQRGRFNTLRATQVFEFNLDNALWAHCKGVPDGRALYAEYKRNRTGLKLGQQLAEQFKIQTGATDQRPPRRWLRWLLGA